MKKFWKFITSIKAKDIVYLVVIMLLLLALGTSIRSCQDMNRQYQNNLIALNDTIHYYEAKNGDLVATIRGFETDLKTLKLLNEDLYEKVNNLDAKGNVTNATYFTGVIEHEKHDTTYVVKHDTINNGFKKNFEFDNEYRILEGNVSYENDTIGVNIDKDQVMFDYTVAMDNKNNIMIHSSNPYVKFNEITGFQLPKQKQKRWSLGPSINFGYDPIQNKGSMNVGISLNYGIIQW